MISIKKCYFDNITLLLLESEEIHTEQCLMSRLHLTAKQQPKRELTSHEGVCLQCAAASLSPVGLFSHRESAENAAPNLCRSACGLVHLSGQMFRFITPACLYLPLPHRREVPSPYLHRCALLSDIQPSLHQLFLWLLRKNVNKDISNWDFLESVMTHLWYNQQYMH